MLGSVGGELRDLFLRRELNMREVFLVMSLWRRIPLISCADARERRRARQYRLQREKEIDIQRTSFQFSFLKGLIKYLNDIFLTQFICL